MESKPSSTDRETLFLLALVGGSRENRNERMIGPKIFFVVVTMYIPLDLFVKRLTVALRWVFFLFNCLLDLQST